MPSGRCGPGYCLSSDCYLPFLSLCPFSLNPNISFSVLTLATFSQISVLLTTIMAPSAVTPPPQSKDNLPSTEKLPTTRKIVIFSGQSNTCTIVHIHII